MYISEDSKDWQAESPRAENREATMIRGANLLLIALVVASIIAGASGFSIRRHGVATPAFAARPSFSPSAVSSRSEDIPADRVIASLSSGASFSSTTRDDFFRTLLSGSAALVSSSPPDPASAVELPGGGRRGRSSIPSAKIPTWTLRDGVEFPVLALNTAGMSASDSRKATELAVSCGLSHVDFHPGIERDGVASYLRANPGVRDGLFLNTKIRKFGTPGGSPEDAARKARDQIDEDLAVLGVDSVDMLMLRDDPDRRVMQSQWKVLEEALAEGKTRSVGLVNYCQGSLDAVLETCTVKPSINYIMAHVGMGRDVKGLKSYSEKRGIKIFSYGQTGELPESVPREILDSPLLGRIGKSHGGRTAGEVALRWVFQNGMAASVRPTSDFGKCSDGASCGDGIRRQVECLGWTLTEGEMAELDAMTSPDDNPTLFSSSGCPGAYGT